VSHNVTSSMCNNNCRLVIESIDNDYSQYTNNSSDFTDLSQVKFYKRCIIILIDMFDVAQVMISKMMCIPTSDIIAQY
jgi:hypothetical protein